LAKYFSAIDQVEDGEFFAGRRGKRHFDVRAKPGSAL
jgi:hypothetical protein